MRRTRFHSRMNTLLQKIHAHIREALYTRRGATHRPQDVPRHQHKSYPRMRTIQLPQPAATANALDETIRARRSYNGSDAGAPITPAEYGTLFGLAVGKRRDSQGRHYPSGGALYPVETYLVTDGMSGEGLSVFHYNPTEHALEYLWPAPDIALKDLALRPASLQFSAMLIFTAVWERSSAKYGDLAYSHALLEAGHMSENVLLVATALGIGARPMAGFHDALIKKSLDTDDGEQPIHSIVLRKHGRLRM
jgi:SagB-type dehydrogenase family enzyme